jgi:23S rRNA (guanosine2251-2'-O)-methyltransferase
MSERVYGLHTVHAILRHTPERVQRVLLLRGRDDERTRAIEALAHRAGCGVERADPKQLQNAVGEVAHQGAVAEVEPMKPWREDDLLAALTGSDASAASGARATAASAGKAPLVLALDGVQDPHNLGACLRTADACGVLAVVIPKDRAAQLSPAARKVAAGAAETTPVVSVTNLARTLQLLKDAGLWIVGTDADAAKPAHEADLNGPLCLVMGAEGAGLRDLTRKRCDWLVRLPNLGAVESLNVSVATGMLLYEAVRQRTT